MSQNFKYLLTTTLVICSILLVGSRPVEDDQLLPTKLRVTVINGQGNLVEGATVSLYNSEEDFLASTDPLKLDRTDAKGRVTFKGVEPRSYYIEARKGEMNNDGRSSKTSNLQEGKLNKVNVVIE